MQAEEEGTDVRCFFPLTVQEHVRVICSRRVPPALFIFDFLREHINVFFMMLARPQLPLCSKAPALEAEHVIIGHLCMRGC